MGEINKILANGALKSENMAVELNDPVTEGGNSSIHIQTSRFRAEMSENEFRAFAAIVVDSYASVKAYKKFYEKQ